MPLLNYTTMIPADKTVSEIQQILAKAGANAVMTEYDDGLLSSVSFRLMTAFGQTGYRLPCDIDATLRIITNQKKIPRRLVNREHATRVGWRIIKNWIEAQCALIETQMATMDQVFLPYAETPTGETVYQRFVESGMSGLAIEGPKK